MVCVYVCHRCNVELHGIDLEYCPWCGSELKCLGMLMGISEKKLRERRTINYWFLKKRKEGKKRE